MNRPLRFHSSARRLARPAACGLAACLVAALLLAGCSGSKQQDIVPPRYQWAGKKTTIHGNPLPSYMQGTIFETTEVGGEDRGGEPHGAGTVTHPSFRPRVRPCAAAVG